VTAVRDIERVASKAFIFGGSIFYAINSFRFFRVYPGLGNLHGDPLQL